MSFKRSIQREKKVEFTHQEIKKTDFQSNFNFTWIPLEIKSFLILAFIFLITQFVCVPLLKTYIDFKIAEVIVHGLLSSLLVVGSFFVILKEKISFYALFLRFCFCALMFGGFTLAIMLLI